MPIPIYQQPHFDEQLFLLSLDNLSIARFWKQESVNKAFRVHFKDLDALFFPRKSAEVRKASNALSDRGFRLVLAVSPLILGSSTQ